MYTHNTLNKYQNIFDVLQKKRRFLYIYTRIYNIINNKNESFRIVCIRRESDGDELKIKNIKQTFNLKGLKKPRGYEFITKLSNISDSN